MELEFIWPPFGLEITVSNGRDELSLRVMRDEHIAAIAGVTPADIYGADIPDYAFGWLFDEDNNSAQFRWLNRAQTSPTQWWLDFIVMRGEEVVGTLSMRAPDFPETKSIETGSWIYHKYQGQGLGTLVRHALAATAFNHFGASQLTTSWADANVVSATVSSKLGYRKIKSIEVDNLGPGGQTTPGTQAMLERADYQQPSDIKVTATGVSPELKKLLGLA
ncbi:GNAT family N-acetyltransferase [Corynebacterium sp. L4756]|uniref:GNAT family N-acetyltransferase n=1 Tax=unclassified Corynebacterium TaxID=2624378 RepID=UPI00374DB733